MKFIFLLTPLTLAFGHAISAHPGGIGVGFHLGYSYGIAYISMPSENTSPPSTALVPVGRVNSTEEDRKTLRKLSDWKNEHIAPPYTLPGEAIADLPRQKLRKVRKALGLPASEDVGAISTLVRGLKADVEKKVGFNITSAAATIPYFPAIYREDIDDAFKYAGLDHLQLMNPCRSMIDSCLTYEASAALAGHGLGLCNDVRNITSCWWDGSLEATYYIVEYTEFHLMAQIVETRQSGAESAIQYNTLDFSLGRSALHNNPNENYYWEEVRKVLLEPFADIRYQYPASAIILSGESAHDAGFRKTLDDVLEDVFRGKVPPILENEPELLIARGTAELVWRRQWMLKPGPWVSRIASFQTVPTIPRLTEQR